MKILIAADSFKGSASTIEVADSIEKGIRKIYRDANITKLPMADGGEGTVDALVLGLHGEYKEVEVTGPLGDKVLAKYGIIHEDKAIIEMAQASGITLLKEKKLNPLITTTYGTGELIKFAMETGIKDIFIGIGGSATNDGGVGMAQALGISFKNKDGVEIGFGGGELGKLHEIDFQNIHPLLKDTNITVISDVDNPLCGLQGASYIYGPQKGGDDESLKTLDENLLHLGIKIKEFTGKDIIDIPGSGAAGGLGAGLIAFCNAEINKGIDMVLDIVDIDTHLKQADLVITGEGKIDGQSIYGKVPVGVAQRGKKYNLPVIAIVGSKGRDADLVYEYGIDLIIDIVDSPMDLNNAMENAKYLIENAGELAMRVIEMSRNYSI